MSLKCFPSEIRVNYCGIHLISVLPRRLLGSLRQVAAQLILFVIALLGRLRIGNNRKILLDGGNRHDLATAIDHLTVGGCFLQVEVLDALAPDLDDKGAIDVLSGGVVGRTASFFVDIFVGLFLGKFVSFGNEGALCPDLVDQVD